MPTRSTSVQSFPIKELTVSEQLDGAFAATRLAWRGGAWRLHLPAVTLAVSLGAFAILRAGRDLVVSQGNAVHPSTWKAVTLGRLGLVMALVVLAWVCMRILWKSARGPLEAPATGMTQLGASLLFLAAWPLVMFAPILLVTGRELVSGGVSLMPHSWPDASGGSVALFVIYWLVVFPFFRLAPAITVIEGLDPLRALGRSFSLARSAEGRVHAVHLFWEVLLLMMAVGLANLLGIFFGDSRSLIRYDSEFFSVWNWVGTQFFGVSLVIVNALWTPQLHLSFFLSYLDLRVRREGLDVEFAARRAGLVPGTEAS